MNNSMSKRNILNLSMLLAPFVICLTVFIDLMVNISHYDAMSKLGTSIWPYFSITLITSIVGFVSAAYILVAVIFLKKEMRHIRTIIITSHLCFLLELFYIIQYVYMLGKIDSISGISVAALIFGIVSIAAFFTAMFLPKGKNFIAYFIASFLYFIFMILMVSILTTRDNGMHIILLIFYSVAMALAIFGIHHIYLRKK